MNYKKALKTITIATGFILLAGCAGKTDVSPEEVINSELNKITRYETDTKGVIKVFGEPSLVESRGKGNMLTYTQVSLEDGRVMSLPEGSRLMLYLNKQDVVQGKGIRHKNVKANIKWLKELKLKPFPSIL